MEDDEILKKAMELKAYKKFSEFLNELSREDYKLKPKYISEVIFFQIFKIRHSMWKYGCEVKRSVDYSLSDIFQDLIAHYLRLILGRGYEIKLEYEIKCEGKKTLKPDIVIFKDGKPHSVIEIKTNIGRNRDFIHNYKDRLKKISKTLRIPLSKCFYILETPTNATDFIDNFYDEVKNEPKKKRHKYIFPLFYKKTYPYYIEKKISDKTNWENYKEYNDKQIIGFAKENVITPFDLIIDKIVK